MNPKLRIGDVVGFKHKDYRPQYMFCRYGGKNYFMYLYSNTADAGTIIEYRDNSKWKAYKILYNLFDLVKEVEDDYKDT